MSQNKGWDRLLPTITSVLLCRHHLCGQCHTESLWCSLIHSKTVALKKKKKKCVFSINAAHYQRDRLTFLRSQATRFSWGCVTVRGLHPRHSVFSRKSSSLFLNIFYAALVNAHGSDDTNHLPHYLNVTGVLVESSVIQLKVELY